MNMNFEENVYYFTQLVFNNIQNAKVKKNKRKEVFSNLRVKLDEKIIVYNKQKKYSFILKTKDIKRYNFKQYLIKVLALYYIEALNKYKDNTISFEEFAEIRKEAPKVVKDILIQRSNISEQLILLRKYKDVYEVQNYIDDIYDYKYTSDYTKYLIDRYYYDIKGLRRPEKNCLERMFKLLLR